VQLGVDRGDFRQRCRGLERRPGGSLLSGFAPGRGPSLRVLDDVDRGPGVPASESSVVPAVPAAVSKKGLGAAMSGEG